MKVLVLFARVSEATLTLFDDNLEERSEQRENINDVFFVLSARSGVKEEREREKRTEVEEYNE